VHRLVDNVAAYDANFDYSGFGDQRQQPAAKQKLTEKTRTAKQWGVMSPNA
jgi:hypothetical protein